MKDGTTRAAHWVRELAIAAAVFLAVAGLIQWFGSRGGASSGAVALGQPAPPFELVEVRSGAKVDLEALRGKPVLLAFWATWCGPCKEELPDLERLHREADGRWHLVTISREPADRLRTFADARGLTLPILQDATGWVSAAYRVDSIPRTLLIDPEGRVAEDHVGGDDVRRLERKLRELGE